MKNPPIPPFFIPSNGFVNKPVTPFSNPENKVIPAYYNPYPTFFAFYAFIYYLFFIYSSSRDNPANPDPIDPVILLIVFKLPAKVFLTKDPAPYIIPKPPSNGPLMNPSAGLVIRSYNPEPILEKSPTGFPMISMLPIRSRIYLIKSFLYLITSLLVMPSGLSKQCVSLMPFKLMVDSSMLIIEDPMLLSIVNNGVNWFYASD